MPIPALLEREAVRLAAARAAVDAATLPGLLAGLLRLPELTAEPPRTRITAKLGSRIDAGAGCPRHAVRTQPGVEAALLDLAAGDGPALELPGGGGAVRLLVPDWAAAEELADPALAGWLCRGDPARPLYAVEPRGLGAV